MLADAPLPSYFCLRWITPIHCCCCCCCWVLGKLVVKLEPSPVGSFRSSLWNVGRCTSAFVLLPGLDHSHWQHLLLLHITLGKRGLPKARSYMHLPICQSNVASQLRIANPSIMDVLIILKSLPISWPFPSIWININIGYQSNLANKSIIISSQPNLAEKQPLTGKPPNLAKHWSLWPKWPIQSSRVLLHSLDQLQLQTSANHQNNIGLKSIMEIE